MSLELQSTLLFKLSLGNSIAHGCIFVTPKVTPASQVTRARVALCNSISCLGVNGFGLIGLPFSNQYRSPFLTRLNCSAMMQENVGPTRALGIAFSETPPMNKSMSSTEL